MVNRQTDAFNSMYLTQLDAVIELITDWPNFKYYADKLRRFQSKMIENLCTMYDAVPEQFNTLIHGDMWTNNIMLKYENASHEQAMLGNVVLVDLQFCCWTSPAIDLQYFFNISLAEKLRLHHQDALIQHYHEALLTVLKRFDYQKHMPTLQEFQAQFLAKSVYGTYRSYVLIYLFMC